jgi:hypothetical protein
VAAALRVRMLAFPLVAVRSSVLPGDIMITGSGRCHGPGCTQTAVVEYWCGERCQQVWAAQFGDSTPKMSRVRLDAAVARLDAEDAAAARSASARITVRLTSVPVEVIDETRRAEPTEPSALRRIPARVRVCECRVSAGGIQGPAGRVPDAPVPSVEE